MDKKKDDPRKVYVHKACVNCKASHVACDAGRPCQVRCLTQRCVRLHKADSCQDAQRKKRGRPANAVREQRFQQQIDILPAEKRPLLPLGGDALQFYHRLVQQQLDPALLDINLDMVDDSAQDAMQAVAALSLLMPLTASGGAPSNLAPDLSLLTKPEEEQTEQERATTLALSQHLFHQQFLHQDADPQFQEEVKKLMQLQMQQSMDAEDSETRLEQSQDDTSIHAGSDIQASSHNLNTLCQVADQRKRDIAVLPST